MVSRYSKRRIVINNDEQYKDYFESLFSESKEGHVSENGEVQKWIGGLDKDLAQSSLDSIIKHLESLKK
jgi:hypothetical protein